MHSGLAEIWRKKISIDDPSLNWLGFAKLAVKYEIARNLKTKNCTKKTPEYKNNDQIITKTIPIMCLFMWKQLFSLNKWKFS